MTLESINPKDFLDEMGRQLHNLHVVMDLYGKVQGMAPISNSDEAKELLKNFEDSFKGTINFTKETMITYLGSQPIPIIRETLNGFPDEQLRSVNIDPVLKNQLYEICQLAQELLEERKIIKELNDLKNKSLDDIEGNDALGG